MAGFSGGGYRRVSGGWVCLKCGTKYDGIGAKFAACKCCATLKRPASFVVLTEAEKILDDKTLAETGADAVLEELLTKPLSEADEPGASRQAPRRDRATRSYRRAVANNEAGLKTPDYCRDKSPAQRLFACLNYENIAGAKSAAADLIKDYKIEIERLHLEAVNNLRLGNKRGECQFCPHCGKALPKLKLDRGGSF